MKVYTKKGDQGKTALLGNQQLSKSNIQIDAYGNVDELNASIGMIRATAFGAQIPLLHEIQNTLFSIGSILASTPEAKVKYNLEGVDESNIKKLEKSIDEMTDQLQPLQAFILPGSGPENALCHLSRTICRRAERRIVEFLETDGTLNDLEPNLIIYLNRLSDYLFTLSRYASQTKNEEEIKWNS